MPQKKTSGVFLTKRHPTSFSVRLVTALAVMVCAVLQAQQPAPPPASVADADADAGAATAGDKLYQLTGRHRIEIAISPEEWTVLQTSSARNGGGPGGSDHVQPDGRIVHIGSGFSGFFPWVHADVRLDGAAFKNVGVRYKGNLSFSSSSAAAPLFASFKMKLDLYGTKGAWDGEKTFNLHAGVVDTTHMREAIAFALFRAAGVPAPRTTYAELIFTVPGTYHATSAGLFTVIEDVNKRFLTRVLPPGTGLLMKPEGLRGGVQSLGETWASYTAPWRPDREATTHEQQRAVAFARLISQSDVALFRSQIGTYLDIDEFLRFIAVNAFIVNTDSYLNGSHNFYLYLDPADDKFRFLPWDEDLSMGTRGAVQSFDMMQPFRGDQPLLYWLLDDPAIAARYRAIVRQLAATVFTAPEVRAIVADVERTVDRPQSPRPFLESRMAYLQELVAGWGQ